MLKQFIPTQPPASPKLDGFSIVRKIIKPDILENRFDVVEPGSPETC
jgi:hypothetical protein